MKIQQVDSEDQEIIIIGGIYPFQRIQRQHRRCHLLLIVVPVAILLLILGYFFLIGEASHQSAEIPIDEEKIQSPRSQINSSSPANYSSFYDFKSQLSHLAQLIQKIQKSSTIHLCLLPQKLFHYYQPSAKVMYFQTAYEIILPSCQLLNNFKWSIDRENIHNWNQNRQVIEWAIRYVNPNDHVLYYRPNNYNILQITILSKIIGEKGSITILNSNELSVCMGSVSIFHGLKAKIQYSSLDLLDSTEKYNALIISGSPNLFKNKITSSVRSLIYTHDPITLNKYEGITIQKVTLPLYPCSELQFSDQLSGQGFYSLLRQGEQHTQKRLLKSIQSDNSIGAIVESDYNKFKQKYKSSIVTKQLFLIDLKTQQKCIDILSPRSQQNFIFTIYGHKIYSVSLQELQGWEKERQAIEWVRSCLSNQTQKDVYYEIQSKFSLLAILEIAHLLKIHSLIAVCSPAQCDRITKQIISSKLVNIQLIQHSDSKKALASGMIITDNQSLINTSLAGNFLLYGSLLGLFSHNNTNNLAFIRKLYVKYHLREVAIDDTKRQCIGFQDRHFFWNSWQPEGFYDINLSKDVIYGFWGGHPSKLNIRKKMLVEEVISASLEVKILSAETFLPFQMANSPIHPAFHLLTSIQKSDYMRVYLMHHYGGGYTDVKHLHIDYRPFLQQFKKQEDKLAIGYAEIHDYDVPCFEEGTPTCREIKSKYYQLIGNGCYFFKKQSVITTQWFNRMTANLDRKFEDLKKNPPQVPRECLGRNYTLPNGTKFISKYPFRWAEIANEHLARVQYKYLDKISTALPYLINVDYRTYENLNQN